MAENGKAGLQTKPAPGPVKKAKNLTFQPDFTPTGKTLSGASCGTAWPWSGWLYF